MASALIDACRRIRETASMSALASRSLKLQRSGAEWKARCPFHPDRSPSFTIYDGDRRWHCHGGCGVGGDQLDYIMKFHDVTLADAVRMIDAGILPIVAPRQAHIETGSDRKAEALAIWRAAAPAAGTLAETYLRSRGLTCSIPGSVRFARLRYGSCGALHPCLVALVASVENKAVGIQRTFLNASGTGKAAVPKPKLSLGHIRGGAIRLAPAAAELVICEGLEDGLTLQQDLGIATWVAAGAGNLATMRLPPGVRSLIIGADSDDTGQRSAAGAARAFAGQGIRVRIIKPLPGFKDFNAELQGVS